MSYNLLINGNFEHDLVGWKTPGPEALKIVRRSDGPLAMALPVQGVHLISDKVLVSPGDFRLSAQLAPLNSQGEDQLDKSRVLTVSVFYYTEAYPEWPVYVDVRLLKITGQRGKWYHHKVKKVTLPDNVRTNFFLEVRVSIGYEELIGKGGVTEAEVGPVGIRDVRLEVLK